MWGKQNHCPAQSTKNNNQIQFLIYILIHIFLNSWLETSLLIFQILLLLLVHKTMWHRGGKQESLYCIATSAGSPLLSKHSQAKILTSVIPNRGTKILSERENVSRTRRWNLTFEYNPIFPLRKWKLWKATYLQSHCQQSVTGTGLWRGRQVKEQNLRPYFSSPTLL